MDKAKRGEGGVLELSNLFNLTQFLLLLFLLNLIKINHNHTY